MKKYICKNNKNNKEFKIYKILFKLKICKSIKFLVILKSWVINKYRLQMLTQELKNKMKHAIFFD